MFELFGNAYRKYQDKVGAIGLKVFDRCFSVCTTEEYAMEASDKKSCEERLADEAQPRQVYVTSGLLDGRIDDKMRGRSCGRSSCESDLLPSPDPEIYQKDQTIPL